MSRLGKISFVLAGLTLFLLAVARSILKAWLPAFWIMLGFVVIFVGLAIFVDRKFFKEFFGMKTTKHGMSMGVVTLLVLTLLGIVNFIGSRHYKTWDFSLSRSNSLSDQSVKILKDLKDDLRVAFFYKKGDEKGEETRRQFRELIKKYQDNSDRVQLEFFEVNERPDMTEKYGVNKGSGVVFVEYKGKRNRVDKIEEQELTSALVKVTRDKSKTIYFVSGHGEPGLDDSSEASGRGLLKTLLENNNYTVKSWQMNVDTKRPEDADVIVISGAKEALQNFEIEALESYLKSGGQLLLALEPQKNTGLEKILGQVGIRWLNNYVLNVIETPFGIGLNQGPTLANGFSTQSDITKVFKNQDVAMFQLPSALARESKVPDSIILDEILKTPSAAIAFKDTNFKGQGDKGSFTLGISAKGKYVGSDKEFGMVVFGDSEFMSNEFLYKYINRDLVLNSLSALAKEESLISITPKEPQITRLDLSEAKAAIFYWGFVIPLPFLLLFSGIWIWVRRRHA